MAEKTRNATPFKVCILVELKVSNNIPAANKATAKIMDVI